MLNTIVNSDGDKVFDSTNPTITGNLRYNETYGNNVNNTMGGAVTPSGDLDDKGNAIYRILDKLNIGFIYEFFAMIDTYLFGFINVLQGIFSSWLGIESSTFVFGIFKAIISVAYIIAAFLMWTDKDIMK